MGEEEGEGEGGGRMELGGLRRGGGVEGLFLMGYFEGLMSRLRRGGVDRGRS